MVSFLRKVYYNKKNGQGTVFLRKQDFPDGEKPSHILLRLVKKHGKR